MSKIYQIEVTANKKENNFRTSYKFMDLQVKRPENNEFTIKFIFLFTINLYYFLTY
jgi:hypothetical protein